MTSQDNIIRSIYLHGLAAVGVLIFSFGAWKMVDLGLSRYVFSAGVDVDYCYDQAKDRIRYESPIYNTGEGKRQMDNDLESNEGLQAEVALLTTECEEQAIKNYRRMHRSAVVTVGSDALGLILVGALLWGGFGWRVRD